MTQIRTKWHTLAPLISAGDVYFTAPKEGKCRYWDEVSNKPLTVVTDFFAAAENVVPKFVIDPELLAIARETDFLRSLQDMQRAGVMRLPYPAVVVEIPSTKDDVLHTFVLIRDSRHDNTLPWEDRPATKEEAESNPFYAVVWSINADDGGSYLVLSPSILLLNLTEDPEHGLMCKALAEASTWVDPRRDAQSFYVRDTYKKDMGAAYSAFFAIMLLMNTQGVKREVIEVPRLNKKRVGGNKPPIPRHTYITIGRVYRSTGGEASDEYIPRRSPRPHWRRGHARMVPTGEGRTGRKQVYIQGRIVALAPQADEAEVKPPTYIVRP